MSLEQDYYSSMPITIDSVFSECCIYHETLTHAFLLFDVSSYLIVPSLHLVFKLRHSVISLIHSVSETFHRTFHLTSPCFQFPSFQDTFSYMLLFCLFNSSFTSCLPSCIQLFMCLFGFLLSFISLTIIPKSCLSRVSSDSLSLDSVTEVFVSEEVCCQGFLLLFVCLLLLFWGSDGT